MEWLKSFEHFGLVGLVVGIVLAMCFYGFRWITDQFRNELESNRKERADYLVTLDKMNNRIEEHNVRSKEFQCAVQTEHREMINVLGRINGYKA